MVRACVCVHTLPEARGRHAGLACPLASLSLLPAPLQDFPFLKLTSQVVSDSTHSSTREKTLDLRTETEGHSGPSPHPTGDFQSRTKGYPGPLLPSSRLPPRRGNVGIFRHRPKSSWSALISTPQVETLPPSFPSPKAQRPSSSPSPEHPVWERCFPSGGDWNIWRVTGPRCRAFGISLTLPRTPSHACSFSFSRFGPVPTSSTLKRRRGHLKRKWAWGCAGRLPQAAGSCLYPGTLPMGGSGLSEEAQAPALSCFPSATS